ncbi:adenylate/guanylate cyclase domain-containing protein [Prosthecobacter sp.]|uniref:adenylate/guanylate cyclase domain-containing protein n=1 Tax=Prosthecobacter sp. TaxID=1965333 RepID=UPI00248A4C36|nr:adenylate/guanylate cyclase domain-containing protein [Prosthecobacter sp.]MDI1315608.1 adenylate/guanylate cyclase domain-containing protein [Prosthecobacter sp.]
MNRNHVAAMFIGVLVCIPLLALYQFGFFKSTADWFAVLFGRAFILPAGGLKRVILLQYGYYTVMAFVSAWVCIEMPSQWRRFAFLLGGTFLTVTFACIMAMSGVLFEPISGSLALWFAGIAGIAVGGSVNGYRCHVMRGYFVGRLSTRQFEELVDQNNPAKMTERREITVLTCRVLNHGELASGIEAPQFEELATHFQRSISEFLIARGAYLDDCNARQVRVFFGFPLTDEDHARHAVQVAAVLRTHLATLTREIEQRFGKKAQIGVAFSTGPAVCGLFGVSHFESFSAVGDVIDFATQLCALNVEYGSKVLLSARTYALAKDNAEVRPMEMVSTVGSSQMSEVYELLAEKGALPEPDMRARDAFWQGVVQYRKGNLKQAQESFSSAAMEGREDAPLKYFMDRVDLALKEKSSTAKETTKHSRKLATT